MKEAINDEEGDEIAELSGSHPAKQIDLYQSKESAFNKRLYMYTMIRRIHVVLM